ncbi:sensor histidine kinase [Agaribacter marinus]|uniref:histidine kinase n=2 Tax=Agaribacter marinus TaxID=1431249 RepID=A0AA37WJC4_9ALTE|nr:sensor histidine kinase [Agaribacter marinus]
MAVGTVALAHADLARYPQELLVSSAQYPDFSSYSWYDLTQLYHIKNTCAFSGEISAHLSAAVEFELKLCKSQHVSTKWFKTNAVLHPAGGSFAERYLAINPLASNRSSLEYLLSADNPKHPLNSVFVDISTEGRDALLNGYRAWLSQEALWLNSESAWLKLPNNTWQPLAKKLNITLKADHCGYTYTNLCIAELNYFNQTLTIASVMVCCLLTILLTVALHQKRVQRETKRIVLQLLTHELRTPIASLGVTIEIMREEFDNLNRKAQLSTWRLLEDYQRLSQVIQASKGYLHANRSSDIDTQEVALSEWMTHVCDKNDLYYSLDGDHTLVLPYYWLTICLNNLIINAKQHGKPPFRIYVTTHQYVTVTVSDAGIFPSFSQRFFKKKVTKDIHNMGIGLNLVQHLMTRLGGRLIFKKNPTRISLRLPR